MTFTIFQKRPIEFGSDATAGIWELHVLREYFPILLSQKKKVTPSLHVLSSEDRFFEEFRTLILLRQVQGPSLSLQKEHSSLQLHKRIPKIESYPLHGNPYIALKNMVTMIAIIGGSGVYDPKMLENVRDLTINTEYGTVTPKSGTSHGKEVFFLARHGEKHSIPPHKVNYRANIKALQELKVERVLATSAVGSLREEMKPGDFVLLDQFLDFTKGRISTFFDSKVVHTDVTSPYCSQLQSIVTQSANTLGITIHPRGTYVCTEGPRFETAAEIKMFSLLGGDVVGMTSVPEVVLARELKMCYASIATVTNFGAGISPSKITHQEVIEIMDKNSESIKKLIAKVIEEVPETRTCECGD